jgi:outer membrane lipoprotein
MGGDGQVRPRSGRFAVALFFGLTLFSGCAPIIPEAVRRDVDRRIPFAALRQDPDAYRGRTLLLGGDILRVAPGRDETELELLERPLDAFDRPGPLDASGGRFLVRHPGFLDSAIYAPGRTLTVAGRVTGAVVRPIGEAPYRYPVLEARAIYLWPLIQPEPLPPARWPYWWHPFWPSARPGWHRYPYWW